MGSSLVRLGSALVGAALFSGGALPASGGVQEQVSYEGAVLGDPFDAEDIAGPVDLSMASAIARVMFPQADPAGAKADEGGGGGTGLSADEAARQSSNPLGGDFMVWINEWNLNFSQGDITTETRNSYTHIFQMVVPIPMKFIGEDWILVNRPTLPIIYDAEVPIGLGVYKTQLFKLGSEMMPIQLGWEIEYVWQRPDPALVATEREESQRLRAELRRRMEESGRREVVIFVHGYSNDFSDAAFTLAELWHFLGREPVPLLYTGPAGHGGPNGCCWPRRIWTSRSSVSG